MFVKVWVYNMNTRGILKDSLSYPLSNWKSYLILGVILIITNLYWYFSPEERLIYIVPLASFVTEFLIVGYLIKIIKSTLNRENVLPKYNGWLNIIFNGFRAV